MLKLFPGFLLLPCLLAGMDVSFTSPSDGWTVTVTPNQALAVVATVSNSAIVPTYYTTQVTMTPTCPPAANPCVNYAGAIPAPPSFSIGANGSITATIAAVNFHAAPPGFYTIKVSVNISYCILMENCQTPGTFGGNMQFTAQVVSAIGPANALAHFAVGGSFTTDLYVINNSSQAAQFSISFYNDAGTPASLPFNGLGTLTTLTDTVPAFGANFYEAGSPSGPLQGGWGLIKADPSITVQGLFRNRAANGDYYEAAVPSYPASNEFRIPFDATTFAPTGDQLYTGFAIVNLDSKNPAAINCTARDFRGITIPGAINVPMLNPLGHWANYLFPALAGVRGTIDCTSANSIAGLGLRFIGTNAFSSLPVITQ